MYNTITEIKHANKNRDGHFFDKSTLKFFNSRIGTKVYFGKFFVTSEQRGYDSLRLYTARVCHKNGDITSVSMFQQFSSVKEAVKFIKEVNSLLPPDNNI